MSERHQSPSVRLPRLHLIVPDHAWQTGEVAAVVQLAPPGAVAVQLRCKHASDRERLSRAEILLDVCTGSRTPLIINDRTDLALAAGAHGVHLGQTDLPIPAARALASDRLLIGATANTLAEAEALAEKGVDYIGLGPIFTTTGKEAPAPTIGLRTLEAVAARVGVPIIAIGGMTLERVRPVLAAGAYGVAVIGAVWNHPSPGTGLLELAAAFPNSAAIG